MAERTKLQQAKFDAAEAINQAQNPQPATKNVVLEVQSVKSGSKSTVK